MLQLCIPMNSFIKETLYLLLTVKHRLKFEALNQYMAKPQSACKFICPTKMYILLKSCHLLVIRILKFFEFPKKNHKKISLLVQYNKSTAPPPHPQKILTGFLTFIGVCPGRWIVSLLVVLCYKVLLYIW